MAEGDAIEFTAKYRDWISIKKLTVRENTTPEEVAFHLAAIRQTLDKKSFEFLGMNLTPLDAFAESTTAGKKKSFKDLAVCIESISSPEAKTAVETACAVKEELKEIANTYLIRRIMQNLKFDTDMNQEMLAKVYPNLKLPKPKGRLPKK